MDVCSLWGETNSYSQTEWNTEFIPIFISALGNNDP